MNHLIRACFNRAAATYDECSQLQYNIGYKLITMLDKYISPDTKIIDIGCGTGKLTATMARKFPSCEYTGLDIADKLLSLTKKRLSHLNANIIQADLGDIPLKNCSFNTAFSNMTLHWHHDITLAFNEIARIVVPRGIFGFSIPLNDTFNELITCQNNMNVPTPNKRFMTTELIISQLDQCRFQLLELKSKKYILYFNNILHLIKSIKNVGANYLKRNIASTLRSKKYLKHLEEFYFDHFGHAQNQLPLTYSIAFIIARKKLP